MNSTEPIVAIATAPGRGAVGIVRISGRNLAKIAQAVCDGPPIPRQARFTAFREADGSVIDRGLAIYFPGPQSYTGEDVLELQAHGGPVVLRLLLARCIEAGLPQRLRLARPGEFTERAFLNGKLDLAQAEAVADLIDASTEAAARSAGRSLSGEFSKEIGKLRDALIQLRVLVEATLDFPEEEIEFLRKSDIQQKTLALKQRSEQILANARQGALLRDGIKIVIVGQPNAGKSSLLNALAGEDLAIVTPIAGTTRDKVQETIQIDGVPLRIVDTAGLRVSSEEVERIGIERAWGEVQSADIVLFVHDLSRMDFAEYQSEDDRLDRQIREKKPPGAAMLNIWNKVDISPGRGVASVGINLSAKTGEGLDALRRQLLEAAGWETAREDIYTARQRHVLALQEAGGRLESAMGHLSEPAPSLELVAEDLRLAQQNLGAVTGEFTSDDLLGAIFSSFCIGK